jgi:aspartate 1-decarboxylase
MLITVMRSKLHRLTITQADLNYVGSITIDEDLLDAAGLVEGEKVQVVNVNNGERIETYTIVGERGSGVVCMNGPAARRCSPGDIVIVVAYGILPLEEAKTFTPTLVFPDTATNKLKQVQKTK